LLLADTVRSFAHMPLGISDRNYITDAKGSARKKMHTTVVEKHNC